MAGNRKGHKLRIVMGITILAILLTVSANATHVGEHRKGRTGDSLYVK